ncbi:MAG TPA: hypothetical protein VFU88_04535 [Ktedonobacterales bacterium]|nr:hypothetical protein [Ktedonobacterales bacterium]
MTTRADYTSEEWALLVEAPRVVALGMLAVSKSGPMGKLREVFALRACLRMRAAPDEARSHSLIAAILARQPARNRELTEPLSAHGDPLPLLSAIIVARLRMLEHSEKVAALLADKTPYSEAYAVKRWLLWIARRIASASGDGWLGTGQKISDVENGMLDRLATSLGMVTTVDALTPAQLEALLGMRGRQSQGADDERETRSSPHFDIAG